MFTYSREPGDDPASQPGLRAGGRVLWLGALFTTRNKSAPAALGGRRGSGPIPATPAATRTRNPGPRPAPAVHCPSQPLPASACASPDPCPLSLSQLTTGPLRLRGLRASPRLQACTSPRGNFPTCDRPHNFGVRGPGGREGRGRAPGGHLPAAWQGQGPSPRGGRLLPKGPQRRGRGASACVPREGLRCLHLFERLSKISKCV